jgi:hypothetical protein
MHSFLDVNGSLAGVTPSHTAAGKVNSAGSQKPVIVSANASGSGGSFSVIGARAACSFSPCFMLVEPEVLGALCIRLQKSRYLLWVLLHYVMISVCFRKSAFLL